MHDTAAMGAVEGVGDPGAVAQRLVEGQRAPAHARREGLALEELHHHVVGAVGAADVEQRADVRVGELRDRLRFPLEAQPRLGGRGLRARQHLDRHRAIQARVAGLVDLAHSPGAQRREDLVGPEASSRREAHGPRARYACGRGPSTGAPSTRPRIAAL
jgi:hypothetical protein